MKKLIIIILSIVMTITLNGCSTKVANKDEQQEKVNYSTSTHGITDEEIERRMEEAYSRTGKYEL